MRDLFNNKKYFENQIIELNESVKRKMEWIRTGQTPEERTNIVKRAIVQDELAIIKSKYSGSYEISSLSINLVNAISLSYESWINEGSWKLKDTEGKEYDQYILSAYDEMLWMLSLGYLLNFPDESFSKLVEVIDRDNVKDYLFEFIIRAKLPERKPIKEESYREYFGVPKVFEKLRQAITEPNKGKSQELIKVFLKKEWYHNHKEAGWYNSHKSKHNTYFGYWSFEAAAVTCIMDLDDSSYRDNEYYPKDLVDYYRSK